MKKEKDASFWNCFPYIFCYFLTFLVNWYYIISCSFRTLTFWCIFNFLFALYSSLIVKRSIWGAHFYHIKMKISRKQLKLVTQVTQSICSFVKSAIKKWKNHSKCVAYIVEFIEIMVFKTTSYISQLTSHLQFWKHCIVDRYVLQFFALFINSFSKLSG